MKCFYCGIGLSVKHQIAKWNRALALLCGCPKNTCMDCFLARLNKTS